MRIQAGLWSHAHTSNRTQGITALKQAQQNSIFHDVTLATASPAVRRLAGAEAEAAEVRLVEARQALRARRMLLDSTGGSNSVARFALGNSHLYSLATVVHH